jgi:predicted NBD/HSP70 family sugar kinase
VKVATVEAGVCIGFGGTQARIASCAEGDIANFHSIDTPDSPKQFFQWMARGLLDSAHRGNSWLVAGFPGPVSPDGQIVGPMANVDGMTNVEYDLVAQLNAADPEVGRTIEQGFVLRAVNDGTLAAHAAASRIGKHQYGVTGALIFGTGVGAGIVQKDPAYANVHRVDTSNPLEFGHWMVDFDPAETYETRYSGPGLTRRSDGLSPKEIPTGHPVWTEQGMVVAKLATLLGLMNDVKLVVPTGGVGGGASDKYHLDLNSFLKSYKQVGNAPQIKFLPEVKLMPPDECDRFEMYGAEGVMLDHVTT